MNSRFYNLINIFDLGDLSFFILLEKKNIKNLLFSTLLISFVVLIISLNIEKKYVSVATLVIAKDENKIVNIDEAYAVENLLTRVNNQIAILKSDEVVEYIVGDKKNTLKFKELYTKKNKIFFLEFYQNQLL